MTGPLRAASIALLLATGASGPVAAQAEFAAREGRSVTARDVERAIEQASIRLASPACALVLWDFTDGRTGRPLAETLSAESLQPGELLHGIRFLDGDATAGCLNHGATAFAWTPVGANVVFLCTSRFGILAGAGDPMATEVLIHEALHTLGLGENPPRSRDITAAVARRCGG